MIEALITPRSYRYASLLATPVIDAWLAHRRRRGKEDHARFGERLGRPSLPRPDGRLVWMHGASVGESLSLLPLVDRLREALPVVRVLITSGTVTSAELLRERLPAGVQHQFVPVDRPGAVRRFRPALAAGPVGLGGIGALAQSHSRNRRRRHPHAPAQRALVQALRRALAAGAEIEPAPARGIPLRSGTDRRGRRAFPRARRARNVTVQGNLKNDAPPLPADENGVAALSQTIGARSCWAAASTHEGEEAMVAEAISVLRRTFPDLLTILAPRHPQRGESIADLLERHGLAVARRSANEAIAPTTAVYLVDTLGDLGLVYRLAEIAFVGGSLAPHGGHNPLEPARLDCALVTGPYTENFAEAYAALEDADAVNRVADADSLATAVRALLEDKAAWAKRSAAAHEAARALGGAVEAALGLIRDHLEPCGRDARAGILGG